MIVGETPFAHQRVGDWNVERLGQGGELARGVG